MNQGKTHPLRVLMITSEWPDEKKPFAVPFIARQVAFLKKAGVQVEIFSFRGNKNPLNYLRAWFRAQRRIRSNNFDLVHAQWGQSGLLALPKRIPLIVTFRGDDLEGSIGDHGKKVFYGVVLGKVSRFVSRFADQIILVSSTLSRSLKRKEFHVIPSGIDMDHFCPASKHEARIKLGLDPSKRYILFVGSKNNPVKRYRLAEDAVSLLEPGLNAQLLVASGIAHENIPAYMNSADVLLLTSLHEGSPNVVKEALACNVPVVSTDVGDVRERIAGLPGCEVVSNDEPATIAFALRSVLQFPGIFQSRDRVAELDEKLLTAKVIGVYQKAIVAHNNHSK